MSNNQMNKNKIMSYIDNKKWTKLLKCIKTNNKLLDIKLINDKQILHFAAMCNNTEILNHCLLNYPNKFGISDNYNNTPVHYLAQNGYVNFLKKVVLTNPNLINYKNNNNDNIMHIIYELYDLVIWFLNKFENIDIDAINNNQQSVLLKLLLKNKNNSNIDANYKCILELLRYG